MSNDASVSPSTTIESGASAPTERFYSGSDARLIGLLRQGAGDLHPYWIGETDSLEEFDVALPAYLNEASVRLELLSEFKRVCLNMVTAEDDLLAELLAEGRYPDMTGKPWSLVDDMRRVLRKAHMYGDGAPSASSTDVDAATGERSSTGGTNP